MKITKLACDRLGLLARLTATRPADWRECKGPCSGVGLDYWYENAARQLLANINLDQTHLTVEITNKEGHETCLYRTSTTDKLVRQYVRQVT
jgi:hypothetical protein